MKKLISWLIRQLKGHNMQKYIVLEDIYYISVERVQENGEFFNCADMSPYIKKGTIVTLEGTMYVTEDGSSVPEMRCRVVKLEGAYELK